MFAFLILLLLAMSIGGLADCPSKLPDCAARCSTNLTGTNCGMGAWNCMCFADNFLENFRQCISKSCTEKESGGASCLVEKQCAIYSTTLTVGRYSTATPIPIFNHNDSTTSTDSVMSTLHGNTTSIDVHTHSSTTSTAPTLSKTPPKTTSPDSSTGSSTGSSTVGSTTAPPAAATTTESGASKSYKVVLGAMAAVAAHIAGV